MLRSSEPWIGSLPGSINQRTAHSKSWSWPQPTLVVMLEDFVNPGPLAKGYWDETSSSIVAVQRAKTTIVHQPVPPSGELDSPLQTSTSPADPLESPPPAPDPAQEPPVTQPMFSLYWPCFRHCSLATLFWSISSKLETIAEHLPHFQKCWSSISQW